MVMTDYMGKVSMVSKWILCCTLFILNLGNQLYANEAPPPVTLVCDDQINVSLGADCNAMITPDLVLQGNPAGTFTVLLSGLTDNVIISPGNYTVTVVDSDTGNSCWGNILAEDKLGPTLECDCPVTAPCDLPFLCGNIGDGLAQPIMTGECSEVVSITYSDNFTDLGCGESTLQRIWAYTDAYGNIGTCTAYYKSESIDVLDDDPLVSHVWCPQAEVQLPCGSSAAPEDIYAHFYQMCFDILPSHVKEDPEDYPEEVNLCVLTGIHKAYPYYTQDGSTIILDGNVCQTFTSYTDIVIPICNEGVGCSDNNKVIREWKIYDWCQNGSDPRICRQTIKASDDEAPSLEVQDFSSSVDPWGCTGTVCFPKPAHLRDNCSSVIDYHVSSFTTGSGTGSGTVVISDPALVGVVIKLDPSKGYIATGVPIGTHTFYYNAYDCCGNTAVEPVLVTVTDATPPVAITKQDIVVSLIPNPGNTVEPGITKIFASNIDNGSFDGCGAVHLEIRREDQACNIFSNLTFNNDGHSNDDSLDLDEGKFVQFCCQDLAEFGVDENGDGELDYARFKVWLRVWDDGDGDGTFGSAGDNKSEVWSWVRLEDKSQPTILCPGNTVVDCTGDLENMSVMGSASAYNSCGEMGVGHRDIDVQLSNCRTGVVKRQWYIIGNESINCIQTITKLGADPTTIEINFPRDTILNCGLELVDQVPTWNAGPCDQMAYNVKRDTFYFQEGACYKVLNYWTVINWCTYNPDVIVDPAVGIWSDVQIVKIFDESAPVIDCPLEPVVVSVAGGDCAGPVMLTSSATDEGLCASNSLIWEVQVDMHNDWNIEYIYSSSENPTSQFYLPSSTSGEEVKITVPEGDSGEHRVLWKVSDGCGNNTTCTTYFTVADNVPPTPYCVNLSTALMETGSVELWACDFDLGAYDNCTAHEDLRFTFSDVDPSDDPDYNPLARCSAKEFTCDDMINAAGTLVTVNVYVWDVDGNSDYCTVFLTLVDNTGNCPPIGGSINISGVFENESSQTIENVEVGLESNSPGIATSQMTDNSGVFMFSGLAKDIEYQVSGSKNDDYLNGVSTLDLVMIQRHILGISEFESPYNIIAADINGDKLINGIDLVELRKLILGIYSEFPQNDSWRFVNSSSSMDLTYPWPLNEIRMVLSSTNMMTEDFIGVKIGDVNGDAIANLRQNSTSNRSNKTLDLSFADLTYEAGDIINMTLTSKDMEALSGLQFTMNFDGLELVKVTGEELEISESNYAVLSEDMMTFSWSSNTTQRAEQLFTVELRAISSGTLSNKVTISSEITKAEAYSGSNLEIIPVTIAGRNNSEQEFALYQNSPNPFNGVTSISFNLPEAGSATVTITDLTGKMIHTQKGSFDQGINTIDVSTRGWNTSGILYYRLETDNYSATKKMIVLK